MIASQATNTERNNNPLSSISEAISFQSKGGQNPKKNAQAEVNSARLDNG